MGMSVVYATVNGRLVQENRSGNVTRYVADILGSVIQTRDASGNQTSLTTYWPFGEVRTSSGANPSPWEFCGIWGYYRDAVNRLYVRMRILRADLSRWLTVDSLWPGQFPYQYAQQSPLAILDSTGLSPCAPADDCDKHPHVPGWYDDNSDFKNAIIGAVKECPDYDAGTLYAVIWCIVAKETKGRKTGDPRITFPLTLNPGKPHGPCQIVPGTDKDNLCPGLDWRGNLVDHMKCCAKILCACLKAGKGSLIDKCGTKGFGKDRTGQFQVINQSGSSLHPEYKCCLKKMGITNPSQTVPKARGR